MWSWTSSKRMEQTRMKLTCVFDFVQVRDKITVVGVLKMSILERNKKLCQICCQKKKKFKINS